MVAIAAAMVAIAAAMVAMPDILSPHREASVVGVDLLNVVTAAAFAVGFMPVGLTTAVDTMAAATMAAEDITHPASALEFIPMVMAM